MPRVAQRRWPAFRGIPDCRSRTGAVQGHCDVSQLARQAAVALHQATVHDDADAKTGADFEHNEIVERLGAAKHPLAETEGQCLLDTSRSRCRAAP